MEIGSARAHYSNLDEELHDDFMRLDEEEHEWPSYDNGFDDLWLDNQEKDIYLNYAIRMKGSHFGMYRL